MGIHTHETGFETSHQNKFQVYMHHRGKYLDLCRKYMLNPVDLSVGNLLEIEFENHADKVLIVKLILRLCTLESDLKNILDNLLFPKTVHEADRSGILRPVKH